MRRLVSRSSRHAALLSHWLAGDFMLTFFATQYWDWMTFLPQFLLDTQSAAGVETGSASEPQTATSSLGPVVVRKPLRRTLRYDRSRKHL